MGYKLSNSSLWGAALGAGGGVGASAFLKNRFQKARSEAYSMGYQDAMNQNVKRHYWLIQNQQSQAARWKPTKTEWVPITLQEQEVNGEVHAERTEYIQVGRS